MADALVVLSSAAVSASDQKPIRVMQELNVKGQITSWALSPDGETAATVRLADHLVLWDLATGKSRWEIKLKRAFPYPNWFGSVAYSPDGALLAIMWNGEVAILAATDGSLLAWLTGHKSASKETIFRSIAFSQDGRSVLTTDTLHARVYRIADVVDSGWLRRKWRAYRGPIDISAHMVVSPNDAREASESRSSLKGAVISSNSRELLLYALGDTQVWSLEATAKTGPIVRTKFPYWFHALSPAKYVARCEREELLLAPMNGSGGAVTLANEFDFVRGGLSDRERCRFSPDGKLIAAWHVDSYPYFRLRVWDLAGNTILRYSDEQEPDRSRAGKLAGLDFSGDGKRLITIDQAKTIRVFSLENGELIATRQHKTPPRNYGSHNEDFGIPIATDSVGQRIAVGYRESLEIWEVVERVSY